VNRVFLIGFFRYLVFVSCFFSSMVPLCIVSMSWFLVQYAIGVDNSFVVRYLLHHHLIVIVWCSFVPCIPFMPFYHIANHSVVSIKLCSCGAHARMYAAHCFLFLSSLFTAQRFGSGPVLTTLTHYRLPLTAGEENPGPFHGLEMLR